MIWKLRTRFMSHRQLQIVVQRRDRQHLLMGRHRSSDVVACIRNYRQCCRICPVHARICPVLIVCIVAGSILSHIRSGLHEVWMFFEVLAQVVGPGESLVAKLATKFFLAWNNKKYPDCCIVIITFFTFDFSDSLVSLISFILKLSIIQRRLSSCCLYEL